MSIRIFDYPLTDPPIIRQETDDTFTIQWCKADGENLKLTRLKKTGLVKLKKAIDETLHK